MNIKNIVIIVLCLFFSGCACKYSQDLLTVVHDHKNVSVETCDSLINSIGEAIAIETDENAKKSLMALKDRLIVMKNQSIAIDKYMLREIDNQGLRELIKSKWSQKDGK